MIIWTMCRWFVVHSYRIPSVWTAQVKQELMEEPWISAEILRTFSPRTRQMLSRLPDTPQSRQIVQQMLDVHGQYRHLLACAISVYLYIYTHILIYHSFGCSQLIEVKQNYLETNTTIPKCWWYYIYIYICINVYRHLCMHASDVLCYTYMILYVNFNSYRRFMCCLLIMSTTQLFSLLGAVPCTSTFLICWGLLRCSWPTRQL